MMRILSSSFTANAAHEPFRDRVRPGSADRGRDDVGSYRREHGIEGRDELGVAVADQEPDPGARRFQVGHQVAGRLGQPLPGGMGCDAEDPYPAGGVLDGEEHIQPA